MWSNGLTLVLCIENKLLAQVPKKPAPQGRKKTVFIVCIVFDHDGADDDHVGRDRKPRKHSFDRRDFVAQAKLAGLHSNPTAAHAQTRNSTGFRAGQ